MFKELSCDKLLRRNNSGCICSKHSTVIVLSSEARLFYYNNLNGTIEILRHCKALKSIRRANCVNKNTK